MEDSDDSDAEDNNQNEEPTTKRQMLNRPDATETVSVVPEAQPKNQPNSTAEIAADDNPANIESETPSNGSLQKPPSSLPFLPSSFFSRLRFRDYKTTTCSGATLTIKERQTREAVSYEAIVAARSKTKEGRAKRSYYGIDIHELMADASQETSQKEQPEPQAAPIQSVEKPQVSNQKSKKTMLWTEKYRARNFMDLCGDDGTNRTVLRWLKRWDSVVFPGMTRSKPVISKRPGAKQTEEEEKPHRKILLLTGPPGLGKTTLAHVCAKQAGYEVLEINASDDRSRDVVKNRIRTSLGTESVKNVGNRKDSEGNAKLAKPVCVVVDEVDGVVSGSGGSGEGGFVKALIDLVLTDQRNAAGAGQETSYKKKKKGDDFRLMRPLVLICNDVYHPSLRPLRQSNLAEIIHVGRPGIDAVVSRLKAVFDKEGIPCDKDAARKLCEAAWGMSSGIDAKRGAESTVEGDLRGVMVVGEWVAGRFRATMKDPSERLTRQWIEKHIMHDLASGAAGSRGVGRGSVKDIVSRLFQEGGGFPKQALKLAESKHADEQPKTELGFGEYQKKHAMDRLRQMIETSGEISYVMTEVMAEYPNRDYNDDCYLTKPNQAYDWLHFHDSCQSRLYTSQEWELAPYLSQPVLACHHLFASPKRYMPSAGFDKKWGADTETEEIPVPFSGPRADYQANEAEKLNRSMLQAMQNQLTPSLMRSFRSAEDMATGLIPYLSRMLSPDVKPVVIGGSQGGTASVRKESERRMVKRASEVLADMGIILVKGKIETSLVSSRNPQYVYRMEP